MFKVTLYNDEYNDILVTLRKFDSNKCRYYYQHLDDEDEMMWITFTDETIDGINSLVINIETTLEGIMADDLAELYEFDDDQKQQEDRITYLLYHCILDHLKRRPSLYSYFTNHDIGIKCNRVNVSLFIVNAIHHLRTSTYLSNAELVELSDDNRFYGLSFRKKEY